MNICIACGKTISEFIKIGKKQIRNGAYGTKFCSISCENDYTVNGGGEKQKTKWVAEQLDLFEMKGVA